MHRLLLALAILLAAASSQAVTPAHQGAGGDGTCPPATTESREPAAVVGDAAGPTEPAVPESARPKATSARPKTGARWHSFLPGMFK